MKRMILRPKRCTHCTMRRVKKSTYFLWSIYPIIFLTMKPNPIIWILWGMWPYASLRAYRLLLDISREYASTSENHDFPHMILDNIPVRELTESTESRDHTVSQVRSEYERLKWAGVNIILMACNTMHLYTDEIYDESDSETTHISLVDTISEDMLSRWYQKVGILGTLNTLRNQLYSRSLSARGINPITLSDTDTIQAINTIIQKLIGWIPLDRWDHTLLIESAESLRLSGAECIILGCTELPLAYEYITSPLPLIDPLEVSIRKACEIYYRHHSFVF